MTTPEPLVLGDMSATLWVGDDKVASTVEMEIDTHRVSYDRDLGTEEKITGTYDLSLDEARKLYDFLGAVLERNGRL